MFRWWQAAAVFAVVGPANAADLSLQRIMLSSGGVGYFEYEAVVDGNATLSLDVPLDQVDDILSWKSRNQTGGRRRDSSSAVRAILDDPPIHIRPVCTRKRGCEGQEPCGFNAFQHAHHCIPPPLRPSDSSHLLSRVSS